MNLFQGLKTMLDGFMSVFFSDWAANNPDVAYRGILQEALKQRAKVLAEAGNVKGARNMREAELNGVKQKLADVERKLSGALRNKDVTVGALLLQQKEILQKQVNDLIPQVEQLNKAAADITHDVAQHNTKIIGLQHEAVVNTERIRSSRAQKRIMDRLAGMSIDTNDQMLQDLRRRVEAEVGEVQVRQEIDEIGNIERKIQRAEAAAEHSGFEAEFENLLKQHEAQQGTHAAQTPPADSGGKQI